MKVTPWIFTSGFLTIILLSWLIRANGPPEGYVKSVKLQQPTVQSLASTEFQNTFEKYIIQNFPSLKYLLYIKNDIYAFLNFGFFHSGYDWGISVGRDGILFEKGYLISAYTRSIDKNKIALLAQASAKQLELLKQNLEILGIPLIMVLAPHKVDLFDHAAPWVFRIRAPNLKTGSALAGPIYAKYLGKADVNFVDCYPPLAQKDVAEISFPDQGAHWSMYGAGICLKMIARKLHELNPAEFPEIEIAGKFVSDDSFYAERDIAKLLNIWPHYKNGRNSHYHAVFRKTRRPLALLVMGDSFMGQLLANMNLSGYTTYENSFHFENRLPTRDEFRTALRAARACIIVGNVQKFITPFWEGYVAALNGYFSGPASLRHGRQP